MEFHGSKLNYGAAYEDDFPTSPSAVLFCNLKTFTKSSEGHSLFWFVYISRFSPNLFFPKTFIIEDKFVI